MAAALVGSLLAPGASAQVVIDGLGKGNAVCTNSKGEIISQDGVLGIGGTCRGGVTGQSTGDISGVKNLKGQGTGDITGFNNIGATGTISGGTISGTTGQFGTLSAGATTVDSLNVKGASTTNGITNTGNIQTDNLNVTKDAAVDGKLTVGGQTTTNGITNHGNISTNTLTAGVVGAGAVYAGTVNSFESNAVVSNAFVSNSVYSNSVVSNSVYANSVVSNAFVSNAFVANNFVTNSAYVNAGYVTTHGLSVLPYSNVDMGNNVVHGVASPILGTDAANKQYVDSGLSAAFREIDKNTSGIAIAMAMAGITLPDSKVFALGANVGFFEDKQAIAVQGAVRLTPNVILNGAIGTGFQDTSTVGGRIGVSAAW